MGKADALLMHAWPSGCMYSIVMQWVAISSRTYVTQDSTGNLGGSLVLSTSTAGNSSSSAGQPVDRLTIDSTGLATFTAG